MMRISTAIVFVLLFASIGRLFGQEESKIKQIIPPSPTVASLAKYGDLPVSLYTGTPTISIPIYEVKTNDFSLPISLSYHASGIKVEEMASWVGLGWSLNAGGIISRSVQGLPDEINGYMNPGPGQKVSEILALPMHEQEEIYKWSSHGEYPDLEPDVFTFNFGSYSGKFYYSQDLGEFVCIPQKAISIDKQYFLTTGKWKIKTEDGTEYHFELKEENTNFTNCGGSAGSPSPAITGWFLTKIITPISKSQITFVYESAYYTIKNISSQTLHAAPLLVTVPCIKPLTFCESQNAYNGYRLKSIVYPNGHVEFKPNTDRIDLIGDKRLDFIEIFRYSETLPSKKIRFNYDYFNSNLIGTIPNPEQLSFMLRLKLNSVVEISASGNELPPHSFTYNESIPVPSRKSFGQDNWGFYNGVETNPHMIPPMRLEDLLFTGANRKVNTDFTAIAILNKITYPTGGFTSFEYENHVVKGTVPYAEIDALVPQNAYLDQYDPFPGSTTIFYDTVVVHDYQSNGVFMTINVNEIFNCDLCPNGLPDALTCAILTLESPTFTLPITCNVKDIFVPNGNYILKANFTNHPNPLNYQDFVIQLSWLEFTSPVLTESKVGGLRIKKMTDDDGMQHTKSKYFSYRDQFTNQSTGVLVSVEPVYEYSQPCTADGNSEGVSGPFIVRKSYSNIPLGTTQGSHIGYYEVSVTNHASGIQGKTVYKYSDAENFPDLENDGARRPMVRYDGYPFAPVTSFDHRRGLLLKQEDFKWNGVTFDLVRKIENEYKPLDILTQDPGRRNLPLYNETKGVKTGVFGALEIGNPDILYALHSVYAIASEWVRHTKTTEYTYGSGVELSVTSTTNFNNTAHQQPTSTRVIDSNGSEITTYLKYPLDFSGIPSSPTDPAVIGIKKLRDDHFVTNVIEKYSTIKAAGGSEQVTNGVITTYKSTLPLPDEVFVLKINQPKPLINFSSSGVTGPGAFTKDVDYESRLKLLQYDALGNLVAQQRTPDVLNTYIWAYNSSYPIAEVKNAQKSDVYHTSFEETGTLGVSELDSKTGIRYYNGSSFTIPTIERPTGSNLKMTFWYYSAGTWQFETETNYSPTITKAGATRLDEIRVYPVGSQMTTYTYKPGIGLSSVTDPNNTVMYYVYDDFGRLKLIKDSAGNIVKSYQYHYKN